MCVLSAGLFVGGWIVGGTQGYEVVRRDTTRVVVYDTVRYEEPVARDSVVVRYVTRRLAMSSGRATAYAERDGGCRGPEAGASGAVAAGDGKSAGELPSAVGEGDGGVVDSCDVVVPITQKRYVTDEYRAYVSGYEPRLDSLIVIRPTVRETVTVTRTSKKREKRFGVGVGVGAGYGLIHGEADVYVGGVVYMRLWPR